MAELGLLVVVAIGVALIFDFFNGVNDAANSIATIVATKVLRPVYAVGLAAVFNFIGPFLLGTAVAATVGKGIVSAEVVTTQLILAALIGAIAWTWTATHFGIPISVSHSLIGGLIGAGIAAAGTGGLELPAAAQMDPAFQLMMEGAAGGLVLGGLAGAVARKPVPTMAFLGAFAGSGVWLSGHIFLGDVKVGGLFATVLFIFYSPLLGFLGGYAFNWLVQRLFARMHPHSVHRWFGRLQLVSASFYSLGHGTNDAQKTMGVIAVLLLANGLIAEFYVPTWVILASAGAIALGTLIGGYRVVRTMGFRLTHLAPHQGFSAETSSAIGLYYLAQFGVPVSTTHSIAGSIMGVGASTGHRNVHWSTVRSIVGAWVLTIPAAALVAWVLHAVLGLVL